MSVLLEYQSLQTVAPEIAVEIENDQRRFLKERCYLAEPLWVRLEASSSAKLAGSNSMFDSGGYTTQSGKWMEVAQDEDYLMAWSDTTFIVEKLADWSKQYGLDWRVHAASDHVDDVVNGEPTKNMASFLEGLLEASNLQPSLVSVIGQKFRNRCEPPQVPTDPAISNNTSLEKSGSKKPWWKPL